MIALDAADPTDRLRDLAATLPYDGADREPGLGWDLHPGYVLRPHDRVVPAAARQGLGELLGGTPRPRGTAETE
ncbi:hypothetical protein GCM10010246_03770 [Streptomyces cuspidosporus]|uniref:Uncharacterized protein n=1 Tax=Streptomyces cuspidosporus TaxID=66882 RepID=A0ABP5SAA1_9ACTN